VTKNHEFRLSMLKKIRLHIEKVEKKQATVDENSIEKHR
jgi:hypothetical protein